MVVKSNRSIVLVVDDSPDSLGMINTALNQAGYTVLVSLNGEQALDIIQQIKPDVVLMDAVMPVLDGFECCKQMRKKLPLTPIIFMTGLIDVEHTVKAFECGGNDYITKPIKPEELLARITSHVNNANMINNARAALDIAKQYVLAVNNHGAILWATPDTRELLQKNSMGVSQVDDESCGSQANEKHDVLQDVLKDELKSALKEWLKIDGKRSDLLLPASNSALSVRYFKTVNEDEHLLRLVEHESMLDATVLEELLPITKRESEVLLWVAHGKTNREIGEILSLSPRTINKHLEQIYTKIQVDNRTAATSIAIQALLGLPI